MNKRILVVDDDRAMAMTMLVALDAMSSPVLSTPLPGFVERGVNHFLNSRLPRRKIRQPGPAQKPAKVVDRRKMQKRSRRKNR